MVRPRMSSLKNLFRSLFSSTTQSPSVDFGLLALRVVTSGAMIYAHGSRKVIRLIDGRMEGFPDPVGIGSELSLTLAAGAEALAASCVFIGLCTRIATIPLIITMAVATFIVHAGDPFQDRELSLIYLVSFTVLCLTGAGRWSLDRRFFGKNRVR